MNQIADDPADMAKKGKTSAPFVVCFQDVDGVGTYYICVEKKVLFGDVRSICKSLAFWFSLHYIFNLEYNKAISDFALFYQEFVFGLPASIKKSATYLTVTSDVQSFAIA